VLAPLQPAAQDDRGTCPSGDLVLAEWSAGHDAIEVDLALSERWISQPESSTLDSDPSPRMAKQAANDDPEETTNRSTEPPGWWPEFGGEQAAAEPDRIVESGAMPPAGDEARHEAEDVIDRPGSGPELERLIASSTLFPEADVWPAVRSYEESAVGALSDVLRVIDARVRGDKTVLLAEHAPGSWEQARALAELTEMVNQRAIGADDARHRRERLISLGEVCVRLRTLVELHTNGILATDQLDAKRASLLQGLSAALARHEPAE
jgi:hypothetical protein